MVRTQIQLTEDQANGLKRMAAERGISMAELIRQSVERTLKDGDRGEKWRRALEIVGKYRSGGSDVAERHDDYLDEAYGHNLH